MTATLQLVPQEPAPQPFCGMVGQHPAMLALFDEIRAAARSSAPVVVEGETGVGKELVVRALHQLAGQPGRPVSINIAAISEQLVETTLFGSVRGAFTGAVDRPGFLEVAGGKTLHLDESGELTAATQLKLLRALEEGTVCRVGCTRERAARFRLVLSVQDPVRRLVDGGAWRADFRYRVEGILLRVPSLAERASDIPALMNHFLASVGRPKLSASGLEPLAERPWPGNVRELRRVAERADFLAGPGHLTAGHLLEASSPPPAVRSQGSHPQGRLSLRAMTRQYIQETLEEAGGDVRKAAAVLDMSVSTLYYHLKKSRTSPTR